MEKEKMESRLIDYIDGMLSQSERSELEKLLSENAQLRQMYEELREVMALIDNSTDLIESPGHLQIFENNLKTERKSVSTSRVISFQPIFYKIAAAIALVMAGVAAGFWIVKNNQQEQELAALRKEMTETKQLMMAMITNGQSASQRMQGVNVAFTISTMDDDVVNVLAETLSSDPNTNVRLAALEALGQFIDEPQVRKIITASLIEQTDPMVKIALIQLLVQIKEKGVVNELEKIINDDTNIQAVKDEAHTGILKLS